MQKPATKNQVLSPTGRPSNYERMSGAHHDISEQASKMNKHQVKEVSQTELDMQKLQHEF